MSELSELDALQAALDAIAPPSEGEDSAAASGAADPEADPADPARYRVQPGDSVESIAAAHDTTPAALMAANVGTLINDNLIIGQFISLP